MKYSLDEGAIKPTRAHLEDAGLDLYVPKTFSRVFVPPHGRAVINTGVHIAIPEGCVGFLKSKSGLMSRFGITSEGTVDEGYTGPIYAIVFNHSDKGYEFSGGDKITQLVIQRIEKPALELVEYFESTERGNGGLGSTGK